MVQLSLKFDLARLRRRAFDHYRRAGSALRRFHELHAVIGRRSDKELILPLHEWLLVPFSLWPIDVAGVASHVFDRVAAEERLDEPLRLLLRLLGTAPLPEDCEVMGAHEHEVKRGRYEQLVKCQHKFTEKERRLTRSPEFRTAWRRIKALFDVKGRRLKRGVIRREMSQERNFRNRMTFDWTTEKSRFDLVFAALCYRWNLYGMQYDRPLLLKISVNPTPHGTMIFIPRYWSLDLTRDLHRKELGKLHRAHGTQRQGPKMSPSRTERQDECMHALELWNQATKAGARGFARYDFVLEKLGKRPETDHSIVKRLLRDARRFSRSLV